MKLAVLLISALLVIFLVIASLSARYNAASIEHFDESHPAYITEETDDYTILPFHKTPKEVQTKVVKHLDDEWENTGVRYSKDFINKTWKFPDALYVMTDKEGEFIGCSGIDREYMSYPFISHIYVAEPYRKSGHGKKLFDVVLDHARKVGYKKVRGWCKDELVPYYETLGAKNTKGSILTKPILGFNLMEKEL